MSRFTTRASTLGDLLSDAAQQWPQAQVIFPDARMTLPELDARSDVLARALIAAGAAPGEHIGVLLEGSLEMLASMFAIAKIGCTIVPINERFRAAELRYVVGHSDLTLLITSDHADEALDFIGRLSAALPELAQASGDALQLQHAPWLRRVLLSGDGSSSPQGMARIQDFEVAGAALPEHELDRRRLGIPLSSPAFLMYTSGTSAEPKGCLLSHEAFTRQGRSIALTRYLLAPGDTFWCPLPLFHNGGIATLLACLSSGASFCHAGRFDPAIAVAQLEKERCTHAIPTFETIWLRVLDHPTFAEADLSHLRVLLNAGSPELLRTLQERVPDAVQLANYGCTEVSGHFSITMIDDPLERRLYTCGHPLPGMEARIIDPDSGEQCPPNAQGEILVRGVSRFDGYYKAPELTAALIDAEGWFHTGDLGLLDADGRIAFRGRLKDMLKVGGENVAAAEVEGFLRTHPAVNIAQVVAAPDAYYGEVPAAFVETAPGRSLTERELIDYCLGEIATFKVPRYVRIVKEWPMSGTKIKKFVLREQIAAELEAAGIAAAPKLEASGRER